MDTRPEGSQQHSYRDDCDDNQTCPGGLGQFCEELSMDGATFNEFGPGEW